MRARLLDATTACLAEHGYARTSTAMVCERAGVSGGARVHHFPTKADLILAAVEQVFEARRGAFRAALGAAASGPARIAEAIDRMWLAVEGVPTEAWLELVVAARSDPVLHAKVVATTERLRAGGAAEMERLGEDGAIHPDALLLASAVMDGLVVQQLAGLGADRRDRVLALLKQLATLLSGGN